MSGGRSLRPATTLLLSSHHHQQTRAYGFGKWSSYLDPELHRELRRRQRMIKYKYAETLSRRMSWDQSPLADDPKTILRRVVGRYWMPRASGFGSRFVNTDTSGRYGGKTVGRGDAESRKSFTTSDPIFGDQSKPWESELYGGANPWERQPSPSARRVKQTSSSKSDTRKEMPAAAEEEEYVIDPITNRKVLRKTYGPVHNEGDTPAETFRCYTPHATAFENTSLDGPLPVYSDGPPPRDELNKYGEVEIDSVSGRGPDQFSGAATSSKEYSLNHPPLEEAGEVYDDLHKYKPSQYDEIQTKAEDSTPKYDDLHQYKPYRHKESTYETTSESPTQNYSDLDKYTPYMHNENSQVSQETPQYEDLGKYENYDTTEVKPEESSPRYEDLDKYKPTHFSDHPTVEHTTPAYKDLDQYQPYKYQESKAASKPEPEYEDLHKYQPTEFENPVAESTDKDSPQYDDLSKYNPTKFHSPVVEDTEKPFEQYGDLDQYKAFRFQEPEGAAALEHDVVAESLKEFDSKNELRQSLEQSMADHIAASDAADREASAHIQSARQKTAEKDSDLTGNYTRDFPEEFAASWTSSASGVKSRTKPSDNNCELGQELHAKVQSAEKDHADHLTQTANASPRLETALDRQVSSGGRQRLMSHRERKEVDADPYSRKPMGLETSYEQECGAEGSEPSYVRMYGRLEKTIEDDGTETIEAIPLEKLIENNPTTAREPRSDAEPTIYKILAYDPTTQNVSIAETTSVVPDQAVPLTPAEVLPRLSNPTKFFPHFAPLGEQGFEIVSGSGDVLIFRKVRALGKGGLGRKPSPVNPIDMMGKPPPMPNAAAFASPTGFINYDLPSVEEQSPPFRSDVKVRRVLSRAKRGSSPKVAQRKKASLTKRILVGGVWVAGISYALSVIAEYFYTGGMDGKGPTGF